MFRKTCFALAVGSVVAALASTAYSQESLSILNYLGRRAARMAAELPPVPSTVDAWEKHRAKLVSELAATLGLPHREPMKAAVTDTKREGDLVVEKVAYLWDEQTYVSATVIRAAESDGRQGAIVIPSGWLGHYTFLPYRKFVDSMARQGFMVLFIDDPRAGLRQAPRAGLYAAASAAGTQVAGIQVFDALRGLDYLLTRADVDPGKIGIAGLGAGALQAYLAAALEPRFQFVVAVAGTTTYEALVQAAAEGNGPEDPSALVAGVLRFTDMDRIAACVAPRPVLIAGIAGDGQNLADGYARVLRTMKAVYRLYDAESRIRQLPAEQSEDITPYVPAVTRWIETSVLPALKASDAAPLACGKPQAPDFSMLRYLQQRMADRAASLPVEPDSETDWQAVRNELQQWLRTACALEGMKPGADTVIKVSEAGGLATERLALGMDVDFNCPAILVRPSRPGQASPAGVVLSHNGRGCAASAEIAEAARHLASAGYWVIVPEHASVHPQSLQPLASARRPSFYGDEAATFYAAADGVGVAPLALRVAEDLAAWRHLAARDEVDSDKIVLVGLGIGGVDACLAAVLEEGIAAAASIDATTVRDWTLTVAPREIRFLHVMPYLPSMPAKVDLDCLYGAIAPRPLVVAQLKGGWPRSGFDRLVGTTSAVYKVQQAEDALLVLGPRDLTEQLERSIPEGIQKQLITAARTLVPTPPRPGLVGTVEGLKPRQTVDSASGLIWLVTEMSDYEQEFTDGGYRLQTWGFFNDNGDAQKGRVITPLLWRKQGDKYLLIGVGKTRINAGSGVQTFPFEPVDGTGQVGEGCFFGWHTGDMEAKQNQGLVEFEDAPDAQMIILAADGQMGGPKLRVGATYHEQARYGRRYSVMAVAKQQ